MSRDDGQGIGQGFLMLQDDGKGMFMQAPGHTSCRRRPASRTLNILDPGLRRDDGKGIAQGFLMRRGDGKGIAQGFPVMQLTGIFLSLSRREV
jgi:hypothetical protein